MKRLNQFTIVAEVLLLVLLIQVVTYYDVKELFICFSDETCLFFSKSNVNCAKKWMQWENVTTEPKFFSFL